MDFWLYLLAVSDGISSHLVASSWISFFAAIALSIAWAICAGPEADSVDETVCPRLRVLAFKSLAVGMVLGLLSALVPTRRGLVEAYAMREGSKIVNAENGKLVATEALKRFDAITDAALKRLEK